MSPSASNEPVPPEPMVKELLGAGSCYEPVTNPESNEPVSREDSKELLGAGSFW